MTRPAARRAPLFSVGAEKLETVSDALATIDSGTGPLVVLDGALPAAFFAQSFPEFAGAAFGGQTTKAVP